MWKLVEVGVNVYKISSYVANSNFNNLAGNPKEKQVKMAKSSEAMGTNWELVSFSDGLVQLTLGTRANFFWSISPIDD